MILNNKNVSIEINGNNGNVVDAKLSGLEVESGATYKAGDNITISDDNTISAKDTTYSAGDGISIADNKISATGNSELLSDTLTLTQAYSYPTSNIGTKYTGIMTYPLLEANTWYDVEFQVVSNTGNGDTSMSSVIMPVKCSESSNIVHSSFVVSGGVMGETAHYINDYNMIFGYTCLTRTSSSGWVDATTIDVYVCGIGGTKSNESDTAVSLTTKHDSTALTTQQIKVVSIKKH